MLEQINSFLQQGNFLAVFIAIFFGIVVNIGSLTSTYESFRRRKVGALKEAISSKAISEDLRKNFEAELETEYFRLVYGVNIAPVLRSKILQVYDSLVDKVAFRHFVRAHEYLVSEDDTLKVKLNWQAYVFHGYNIAGGFVVFILGLVLGLLFLLALSTAQAEVQQLLSTLSMALIFVFFGAGMVLSGRPLISARILRTALNENL